MLKVNDIMTHDVKSCHMQTSVGEVARIMRDNNCGVVPVLNDKERITGIVTDRDICLALTGIHPVNSVIAVEKVMTRKVFVCTAEENISDALNTMRTEKVRRLPVVEKGSSHVVGILSIDDVILHIGSLSNKPHHHAKGEEYVNTEELVRTLKALSRYGRTIEVMHEGSETGEEVEL